MKSLLTILLMTGISAPAFSAEPTCEQKLESYSHQQSMRPEKSCFDSIRSAGESNPRLYDEDVEGIIKVYGHNSSVLIDNGKPKVGILGGKMTGLNEILALSLSDDGRKLAILNRNDANTKEVLIFSTGSVGNVVPLKIMREDFLNEMSQVSMSGDGEFVMVLDEGKNEIFSISSKADSRSRNPAKAVSPESLFKGEKKSKIMQIIGSGSSVLILTSDAKVSSINSSGGKSWSVDLPDKGIQSADAFYLSKGKLVFKSSGEEKSINNPAFD